MTELLTTPFEDEPFELVRVPLVAPRAPKAPTEPAASTSAPAAGAAASTSAPAADPPRLNDEELDSLQA
eukprot:8299295-Heterocapsa_arctica.AAC.1